MRRVVVLALLALAACGTPQERCIHRNTKDLRAVQNLVQETEGNLARGYAIEHYTISEDVLDWCYPPPPPPDAQGNRPPPPPPFPCERTRTREVTRNVAIDLKAEAEKLKQLRAKQAELSRQAQSVIAQCKAMYPEEIKG